MSPRAETGRLQESVTRVTAALETFLANDENDPLTRRDEWSNALSGPLPENGVGVDAVLGELERIVIPNGTTLTVGTQVQYVLTYNFVGTQLDCFDSFKNAAAGTYELCGQGLHPRAIGEPCRHKSCQETW